MINHGMVWQGVPLASNQIQYSLLSRTVGDSVKEVGRERGRGGERERGERVLTSTCERLF